MKILFITEAYAPDSIIGAQRIIKFSKYLSLMGHDVTVLTTSRTYGKIDQSSLEELKKVKIVRSGGDILHSINPIDTGKVRSGVKNYMPKPLYRFAKKIYSETIASRNSVKESERVYREMKDCYEEKLAKESFDVVFCTYSTMPDVLMGEYINEKYGVPFVLDLRDKMDNALVPYLLRKRNHKIQKRLIEKSAKTFIVSEVAKDELIHDYPSCVDKIATLYNGFDTKDEAADQIKNERDILTFAYTGGLYSGQRDLSVFFKVLKSLMDKCGYKFSVEYAGEDFEILRQQADRYQIGHILNNHGSVSRHEAEKIQNGADVFLVASWIKNNEKGVLTGKFFEGIRAKKPIVTVVRGDLIGSELYRINQNYNYGICCETARNGSVHELQSFIKKLYKMKVDGELNNYEPGKEIREKFHYKNLSKELEKHLLDVVGNGKHKGL